MFTGIVQAVGRVAAVAPSAAGRRCEIDLVDLAGRPFKPGDSIAVNGACLTVAALGAGRFQADVSPETIRVTTLGGLVVGDAVNLEPALTLVDPLGGHLVTGHVDGTALVAEVRADGTTTLMSFELPPDLCRYAARKGSICIDGVSLTVNSVAGRQVGVTLVPHTLQHTIMGRYAVGTRVNVEVDLVARYVERLMVDSQ